MRSVATPVPRSGDVLVRVYAASVHPGDVFVVTGVPYVLRLAFGLRRPGTGVPGRDLAGRVESVGADVRGLRPVQSVLITGASGGVGSFAVQIAKGMGAEVTGVCSKRNVGMVRALGADHVVDYGEVDFTRSGLRHDVILDNVEAQPLAAARRALAPTGTLIPNSGEGGRWFGPLGRIVAARVRSRLTRQHLRPFLSVEKKGDLLALAALVEAGTLTPVVDRTYPLEQAAAARACVGAGHARGKVVVAVDGSAGVGAVPQR